MVPLNDPALQRIVGSLKKCDSKLTVAKLGGLLTEPKLQANNVRMETLVHLAVAHCRGRSNPSSSEISRWLNKRLLKTQIPHLEDPAEDVFVTNVETAEGNLRVFEGTWESSAYSLQIVVDILADSNVPQEFRNLLIPVFALLKLSDCVAERIGLQRWHVVPSTPCGVVKLPSTIQIGERARAITFTANDLSELGINLQMLRPFLLRDEGRQALASETTGNSSLERHPILVFGSDLVLTLPTAVSPAIRRFVLSEVQRTGHSPEFFRALATRQAGQVDWDGLREIKRESTSLLSPVPEDCPPLDAWLFKYDIDKFLHVVLLQDPMDSLESQDLSSVAEYPEKLRSGLEKYLIETAHHCKSLPDFVQGMTLLVRGGLGRGLALGFGEWPDQWTLSFIRISDLLLLGDEGNRSLAGFLKCIERKKSVEEKGVFFQNTNGDYNFYCYWRNQNYQLVPRDFSLNPKTGSPSPTISFCPSERKYED